MSANKDAAIESHASSIQRACPVSKASAAPMLAISSAKPATAQSIKIRTLTLLFPTIKGPTLQTASTFLTFRAS